MKKHLVILSFVLLTGCKGEVVKSSNRPAEPIIRAAHRYHGLAWGKGSSVQDEFGYNYFVRGGKRCRLLNREFLRYWKERR